MLKMKMQLVVVLLIKFLFLVNGFFAQEEAAANFSPALRPRYSAASDVSHISYNSPLVSYGDALNDIQLPAMPIQPANLFQSEQQEKSSSLLEKMKLSAPTSEMEQFISIHQYPHNPQFQRNQQPTLQIAAEPPHHQQQFAIQYNNILPQEPKYQFPSSNSNGYFATGPFAAAQQQQFSGQIAQYPKFVSKYAFNSPTASFSNRF